MYHCSKHSIHHESYDCPRCAEEERHEQLLEVAFLQAKAASGASKASDYKRANPGDYLCPHCRYIALKRWGKRCPLCHGEVESSYWSRLIAAEAAAEAARVEELERTAPAREAAARAAAEADKQILRKKRIRCAMSEALWAEIVIVQWGFIAGILKSWVETHFDVFWNIVLPTCAAVSVVGYAVAALRAYIFSKKYLDQK